ncbi:YciI family protein [Flavobacterium filum]|uniref:YciI family protein n=1 Tax=Flavobacterium filum TaxID=370974 RepID=UPI0023F1CBC9|nr:YciI family protein [Flavobacterium filum]
MEKFILLFRGGNTHISTANSQAAMDVIQTWNDWMQGLAEKGILAGGDALKVSGKHVKGTKKVVSDGPYAEGNELVGGYLIINANDINDAVEISKGCPILIENGSVEVRPIQLRN